MKFKTILLIILAIVTTVYLVILGWFNSVVADDYEFVWLVERYGIWGFMTNAYMTWQCRFTYYLELGVIYELFGRCSNLVLYTVSLLILGYASLYTILKDFLCRERHYFVFLLSIVLNNLAILSFFELSTFYWLCTPDYFILMYVTILLVDAVFLSKNKAATRWLVLILTSIYICGNLELYLAILIFFIGTSLLIWFYKSRCLSLFKNQQFQMLFVSFLIMFLGFIIQWVGPGTQIRMAAWQDQTGADSFIHSFSLIPFIKAYFKAFVLLLLRLLSKAPYYILFFILASYLGYRSKESLYCDSSLIKKRVLYVLGGFLIFFCVTIGVTVFSIGCLAPIRSYTFIHYLFIACILYVGIISGANKLSFTFINKIYSIGMVLIILVTLSYTFVELPIVKRYKQDITTTLDGIQRVSAEIEESEPIIVKPVSVQYLPDVYSFFRNRAKKIFSKNDESYTEMPGFFPYFPFELSEDPNDFRNRGLREYLNVNNDIIGWSNSTY